MKNKYCQKQEMEGHRWKGKKGRIRKTGVERKPFSGRREQENGGGWRWDSNSLRVHPCQTNTLSTIDSLMLISLNKEITMAGETIERFPKGTNEEETTDTVSGKISPDAL